MNKFIKSSKSLNPLRIYVPLVLLCCIALSCQKNKIDKQDLRDFQQVNLVANNGIYGPVLTDPTLQNAWGIAWSPTGIAWVNAEAGHVSELYTGDGAIVRPPVNIPSPTDPTGGAPTGIVFAAGAGFKLQNGQGAAFLFVGDDGVLSGWNGAAGNNAFRIKNNSATAGYFGLAINTSNFKHFIYAANFKAGKIDVWDTTFTPVNMAFKDPGLPASYSPFNIQSIGPLLFVMYAKQGPGGDEIHQVGLGLVDVYNTDGTFIRRFTTGGLLNSPWGCTMAPAGFLEGKDMGHGDEGDGKLQGTNRDNDHSNEDFENQPVILIGNFGDGHINVFSVTGQFLGQLQKQNQNHPITIDGLWGLSFAPSSAPIDPMRLYFSAGPKDETDGLFGYLIKK
ncbi:MAG: TIGR03118 family protein [Bacteroidetes bacterium]|nr:MAG: TIGR03118 family protein [Bacteroidota bacterium]